MEARRFLARECASPGARFAQRAANQLDIANRPLAFAAPGCVRADRNLLGHGQLVVVKRVEAFANLRAGEDHHAGLASWSVWRRVCRARVKRDLTVPTATPRE